MLSFFSKKRSEEGLSRPAQVPRVIYWNNIPAPYMVDRFNALAKRGNVHLEVWFNARTHSDRSWTVDERSWCFHYRYLPRIQIGSITFRSAHRLLWDKPDLMISLHSEPVFVVGWLLAHIRGVKTGFRVLKTFDSWVTRNAVRSRIKRFMFARANAIETPGKDGRDHAISCGADPDNVHLVSHTVDRSFLLVAAENARGRRDQIRAELKAIGTTFIYVGRLWHGKGIDLLLDAFKELQDLNPKPVSLVLVGDGQDEGSFMKRVSDDGLRNVAFAGFRERQALVDCLVAADVFVFPTLGDPYGIAVDEAMTCGLPVISTSAAGEIHTRVIEGVTGYVVTPNSSVDLATAMGKMSTDQGLPKAMGLKAAKIVEKHTPTKWAEDFERMVGLVVQKR